jgi:hypothetical protein
LSEAQNNTIAFLKEIVMDQKKIAMGTMVKRRKLLASVCSFSALGAVLTQGANNTAHAASQQMLEQQKANGWQARWSWCHKCQGLFFSGNSTLGVCPAGGSHSLAGSGAYQMYQE